MVAVLRFAAVLFCITLGNADEPESYALLTQIIDAAIDSKDSINAGDLDGRDYYESPLLEGAQINKVKTCNVSKIRVNKAENNKFNIDLKCNLSVSGTFRADSVIVDNSTFLYDDGDPEPCHLNLMNYEIGIEGRYVLRGEHRVLLKHYKMEGNANGTVKFNFTNLLKPKIKEAQKFFDEHSRSIERVHFREQLTTKIADVIIEEANERLANVSVRALGLEPLPSPKLTC